MGFDGYGLQQQLLRLWQDRQTGTLTSAVKGYEKKLFLKEGLVCFATSTDPDDKLPSVLVRQGRFTEEQFLAVEPKFNDKISIGRNLIEMGLITQAELVEGAKEQIYTVFASCMLAESGNADFEAGPLPNGIVSLPLRYPRDLFRAILGMQDKIWISRQFGNALSFVPTPVPDRPAIDFSKLDIGDFAQPTYKLIDGQLNFNHLTFESDVDEFTLLKFLYVLRQLGYISIEADDNEPEPEVESVLEDLGRAMEQSKEVERLRGDDFSGVSMDETIAMPTLKAKGAQPIGSFDATTEISRDVLERKPLDDLFDDEADYEPKAPAAAAMFGAMDEDEEQGLDDLSGETPDFLEREIQRDQFGYAPEGVVLPDRDDFEEDEQASEAPADDGSRRERRNRLMLLAALGVMATGALLTLRPWIERHIGPTLDWTTQPPKQAVTKTPPTAEPAQPTTAEPEPEPEATQTAATPQDQTAASQNPSVEQSQPKPPAPVETAAAQKPVEKPAVESKPEPAPAKITAPEPQVAATGAAFRSPIGEGWDPKTGRPRGQTQAPIQKIPEPEPPSPELLQASTTSAQSKLQKPAVEPTATKVKERKTPASAQVKPQNAPTQSATAQTDVPTQPKPSRSKPPATKQVDKKAAVAPETSKPAPTAVDPPATTEAASAPPPRPVDPEAEARRLLAEGRYAEAAALWRRKATSGKYTFALFLVCDQANIDKALQAANGDARLFILAREQAGSACYWVCWGNYDSRVQALKARAELPPGLADTQSEAKAMAALLK